MADFSDRIIQIIKKAPYSESMNLFIKYLANGMDPGEAMMQSGFGKEFSFPAVSDQGLNAMNAKGRLEGYEPTLSSQSPILYPGTGNYTEMAQKLRQPRIKNPPLKDGWD